MPCSLCSFSQFPFFPQFLIQFWTLNLQHNGEDELPLTTFRVGPGKNFVAVQSLGLGQHFAVKWTAEHQASLFFTLSQSLLKFIFIKSMMLSNHLILGCPLLLLHSVFHSIRFFSSGSALYKRWPQFWSFDFSISPSNVYSELISFRIDSFDLLAVQGTLKSLLQHHSRKASVLQILAFLMVQLSHPVHYY